MEPTRPHIVIEGTIRRIVIDAGCVWVEESAKNQRALRGLLRLAGVLVVARVLGSSIHLHASLSSMAPALLVCPLILLAVEVICRVHLRSHVAIAPTGVGGWTRIACADPVQRWFWFAPQQGIALHAVRPVVHRGFQRHALWTFSLCWPGGSMRIRLARAESWSFGAAPRALADALALLQRWGFGR